jgi:hypothetical protein
MIGMSEPQPSVDPGRKKGLPRVLSAMDSTTKILLALGGLIAAVAGVWATATGVWAGQDPSPPRATPSVDLRAQAAEKVASCELRHKMPSATQVVSYESTGSMQFKTCEWPPSDLADADGYWEIRMNQEKGPGDSEASGMDYADRINGPCEVFEVTYDYGHMGEQRHLKPFTVARAGIGITTYDGGEQWTGDRSTLPFYPGRAEAVVLTSGHYGLVTVRCAE